MPILIIIALGCFLYAAYKILQAIYILFKALFYKRFANEKQIDKGFEIHLKKSDDYKTFENKIDEAFKDGI